MIRRPIAYWLKVLLGVVGVLVIALIYEGLSIRQSGINPSQTVVPGVTGIMEGIGKVLKTQGTPENPKPSWLWEDFRATYWRLLLGVVIGVVMSLIVGMAVGAYTPVEATLNPMITFMASVPPTAMLGVYMIVFGTHLAAYVALVAFGIFFSMVQSIAQAVQTDVNSDHIDKAYTLGASEVEVLMEVVWRQILPRVFDAIRSQLGPAMIYLIAAEALFAGEGFGYRIKMQSRFANMDVVFVYLFVLGANGLLLNFLLLRLRRRL
ncbi:MAG: ABC transporter permease subunit, partial [Pirellulaceae bacterium]|nr:ABC transporter permease subunit [Pirellulaceae bacterium]